MKKLRSHRKFEISILQFAILKHPASLPAAAHVDSGVIRLKDLLVVRTVHRHPVRSHLTHPDSVPPAAAIERHPDQLSLRIPFFIEVEKAVPKSQERA